MEKHPRILQRMSNAEEPVESVKQNQQTIGEVLPEQGRTEISMIPRPVNMMQLAYQWQPMGFRIKLNIPFISDDYGFLFVIRNGPFIPTWRYPKSADKGVYNENDVNSHVYPWNNMRPVFLVPTTTRYDFPSYPENFGIALTQYDLPPFLSTLSQCFRRWKGDMAYRIRVVSGFATQGYIVAGSLKNQTMPTGVYNEYDATPIISRLDKSYREVMASGYVMSDVSMFRHMELTMPFDYPVPWYDQYQWIANRATPWATREKSGATKLATTCTMEPHGDNWLTFGVRGELDSPSSKSVIFELEYRACEGFVFDEPGVPPVNMLNPYYTVLEANDDLAQKTVPDKTMFSNGLDNIKRISDKPRTLISRPSSGSRRPRELEENSAGTSKSQPSDGITHPVGEPLGPFATCEVDRRVGRVYTHCQRHDGTWLMFSGDQRHQVRLAQDESDLQHLEKVSAYNLLRRTREPEFS